MFPHVSQNVDVLLLSSTFRHELHNVPSTCFKFCATVFSEVFEYLVEILRRQDSETDVWVGGQSAAHAIFSTFRVGEYNSGVRVEDVIVSKPAVGAGVVCHADRGIVTS